MHLGSVHNKLDEVLMEKGLRPLKIQVPSNIRKIVVKRERMEEDSNTGDVPDYQLPNLFESVVPSSSGQDQVGRSVVALQSHELKSWGIFVRLFLSHKGCVRKSVYLSRISL